MPTTDEYRKLRKVIESTLSDLGFGDIEMYGVVIDDDGDILQFLVDILPGALMTEAERETLNDFNSIVSGLDMESEDNPALEKLKKLRDQHKEEWGDDNGSDL